MRERRGKRGKGGKKKKKKGGREKEGRRSTYYPVFDQASFG